MKVVLQRLICFLELLHLHEKGINIWEALGGLLTDTVNEAVTFRIVLLVDGTCSTVQ